MDTEGGFGSTRARRAWFLGAVLILALAARLVFAFSLEDRPYWPDAREYHNLATGIVEEGHYAKHTGATTAFRPPGYPLFLASFYLLSGPSARTARIIQALIGAATCLLLYHLALRLVGRRPAALAAAICAAYPLFIYATGTLYPETLQALLLPGAICLWIDARDSGSGRKALGAGIIAAWSALTIPSGLPALLVGALWLVWGRRNGQLKNPGTRDATRTSLGPLPRGAPPSGLRLAAVYLLPIVIIMGAWTVRNYRVFGSPVLGSTNAGYNFWLGNHPDATASSGNRLSSRMSDEQTAVFTAHRNEVARNRIFMKRGLRYVRADWGRFARLSAAKAANLWRLYPAPITRDHPGFTAEKLLSILSYGLLLPFAVAGLARSLKSRARARMVLLFLLAYTLAYAPFIAKVRFRIPVDSLVIVYGAGGLTGLVDAIRARLGRSA